MPEAGDSQLPPAHLHIFTVIRTLMAEGTLAGRAGVLRILDVGCGDGRLMAALANLAERHLPDARLEVHGFDIGEHGFRDEHQMVEAVQFLSAAHPSICWTERIRIVSEDDDWGYPPGYFDLAVSNQVIEHVDDLPHFLRNLRQALRPDGLSVHFFPLRHCVAEAHCKVPFAHWIRDHEYRVAWIALMSRLGIGRYRYDRRVLGHPSPRAHAEETAKFIGCWTRYRSFAELAASASQLNLAISYSFTKDFFLTKLRSLLRRPPAARYRRWNLLGLEWLGFVIGRYISSSTLTIRPIAYDIGVRIAAEKADRLPEAAPIASIPDRSAGGVRTAAGDRAYPPRRRYSR